MLCFPVFFGRNGDPAPQSWDFVMMKAICFHWWIFVSPFLFRYMANLLNVLKTGDAEAMEAVLFSGSGSESCMNLSILSDNNWNFFFTFSA